MRSSWLGRTCRGTWVALFVAKSHLSNHRYLLARTETSATFDAHTTRLKRTPRQTYGHVALGSRASDGQGAGRGFHEMDSNLLQEIDCIVELTNQAALVRFVGSEINDRWVPLEEMLRQDLSDLVAEFKDGGDVTMARVDGTPRFTMPASVVARLESKRTHDSFQRRIGLTRTAGRSNAAPAAKMAPGPTRCCAAPSAPAASTMAAPIWRCVGGPRRATGNARHAD